MVTLTTLENQRKHLNNNMTTIDLGYCETLLKNGYNISDNETIYMKKIDIAQERIKTTKVEFDVYCKLNGTNLIKLNLTSCANTKISIFIPIKIIKNVDEYNSSSGYYNDICYTTTSEYNTDISIKDRRKKFIDEDKIICQEDCLFSKYESNLLISECLCDVKESSFSFVDMAINKGKIIFDNFINIKNFANLNILICHKKLFNEEGIIHNIGSYLLIIIISFHIISIFIFYLKQLSLIKMIIKDIIKSIKGKQIVEENKKRTKKGVKSRTKNPKITKTNSENKKILNYMTHSKRSKKNNKETIHNNTNSKNKINNIKIGENKINNLTTNIGSKNENKKEIISFQENCIKQDETKKSKNIFEYIDEEINLLPYDLAMKHDKRSYCIYYFSLLKTKHNLIFALLNNDYNSRIIKMNLFWNGFAIKYVVNALFFNDDTMNKIYESKGSFDLEVQIPITIYSSLISIPINKLLGLLALTNDAIITFKHNKSTNNLNKREKDFIKKLKVKFILYYIISSLFLLFFWYYISMFGVIYKNTQLYLLKDTLISLGQSLLIPFGLYLIPGLFRIPALSNRKNKRKYLYNFSKFLQIF